MLFKHQTLILNIPLLLIGFFLLNRAAGLLIDGGASIARKLRIPESMIAFTVVAVGANLPKLFTNILAAMNDYDDLLIGNIIGSNIVNLLGIISIVGLNRPIRSNRYSLFIGIPFALVTTAFVFILSNNKFKIFQYDDIHTLTMIDGFILLGMFVFFMTYAHFNTKKHNIVWFTEEHEAIAPYSLFISILFVLIGIMGLCAGAILVVDNLIDVSRKYDISQRFLGQFILAIGGSFVVLWWTKNFKTHQSKLEFSSLLGTNMLHILGTLGACALIAPIQVNKFYSLDLYILIAVYIIFFILLLSGKKLLLKKWKCQLLLLLFFVYIAYLFLR